MIKQQYKLVMLQCWLVMVLWCSFAFAGGETESEQVDTNDKPTLQDVFDLFVVTATKHVQAIAEAPAIMTVITADQIKERGYQSVGEALQSVAGLDVLHDHLQYNVGVRGINGGLRAWSRIIKVMIDGQPVSFRPSTENFLGEEMIPIAVVERIEIVRGPGSALYGANAFLGVVNVITKKGEQLQHVEMRGKFGLYAGNPSFSTGFAMGQKAGGFEVLGAGHLGRYDRSGLSPINIPNNPIYSDDDLTENDISRPASLFAKLSYTDIHLGQLALDFNYQRLDSVGEFQDWATLSHNNRVALDNMYVRGAWSKKFAKRLTLDLSVAYARGGPSDNERINTGADQEDWITRDLGNDSLDVVLESSFAFDKHSNMRLGLDYTFDYLDLQTFYRTNSSGSKVPNQGRTFGETDFQNLGIYGQTMIFPFQLANARIDPQIGFILGLRFDWHNEYGNQFNYRVGAVYKVNQALNFKLLFGTSFKPPASTQLYTNMIRIGGVDANPELKPEKARTLELMMGLVPYKLVSINVNGFYSKITDKVELVIPTGVVSNYTPQNISSIESLGIESEIEVKWKHLSSYLNYSYQWTTVERVYPIEGRTELASNLYPSHLVKFGANYKIPKIFFNFNLEGRYVSQRIASESNNFVYDSVNYRTNRYSLDDYVVFDALFSTHELKLLKPYETVLGFKIYNIFDNRYAYPGFKDCDIPALGRTFIWFMSQQF